MFCPKCGQENDNSSIFCHKCGEKIIFLENSTIKKEENKNLDNEIELQIKEYNTLPWYKSYRKISALLFVFSSVITIIMVFFDFIGKEYLLDLIIIIPLSIFMYKGKKWAFIASIIYWIVVKIYQIYLTIDADNGNIIMPILWLITYVSVFSKALNIEWQKDKIKNFK